MEIDESNLKQGYALYFIDNDNCGDFWNFAELVREGEDLQAARERVRAAKGSCMTCPTEYCEAV